jgi:DNA polymerase III delta subunit
MHSKWLPWDFFKNHNHSLAPNPKGFFLFSTFDPTCERLIIDHLPKETLKSSGEIKRFTASDISIPMLEEELLTISLFKNLDTMIVYFAEGLSDEISKFFKKIIDGHPEIFEERTIIFFYTKKTKGFDLLAKEKSVKAVTIENPPFWDYKKSIDFLASYHQMKLSVSVREEILRLVPPDFTSLDHALKSLKLYFGDRSLDSVDLIQKFFPEKYIDQFQIADDYSLKKRHEFFAKLTNLQIDYDDWRAFLGFMQSHILKLLDPSYMNKKNNPSKYDQKIKIHAKLWKREKLMSDLKLFSELEIMAKMKTQDLQLRIKEAYLNSFKEEMN